MTDARKTIPPALAGPLDRAVRSLFEVSWGRAREWIETGKVLVDGAPCTDPTARVVGGAELVFVAQAPRQRAGRLSTDQVRYADPHVVVVSKPPGVSTIPYGDEKDTDTLEGRVRRWLEHRGQAPRGARPNVGIVHRLDKETSGLVVFTRTWLAKQQLAGQFRKHTVHRRYLALAHGSVRAGTVRTWLVEDRGDGLRGSASTSRPSGAREAVTHIERLECLGGATLVACRLETGRTHQIRIHLSEAGHPVVGERVYVRRFAGPRIDAPRLMLHASELGFVHPATEREMRWEEPLPDDMQAVLARLRQSGS